MGMFDFLKKKEALKGNSYDLPPLPPVEESSPQQKLALKQEIIKHDKPAAPKEVKLFPPIPAEHKKTEHERIIKEKSALTEKKAPLILKRESVPSELPDFPLSKPASKSSKPKIGVKMVETPELKPKPSKIEKPIFVSVTHYRKVLGDITNIQLECENCSIIIDSVSSVRNQQDTSYNNWRSKMEDLQRKFLFMDKTLFEKKYT